MVAFAGHKYAARSNPVLVSDSSNTITSFTLVSSITLERKFFLLYLSSSLGIA